METRTRSSGGADGPDGAIAACLLLGSTSILRVLSVVLCQLSVVRLWQGTAADDEQQTNDNGQRTNDNGQFSHPIAFAPGCPRPDCEELMASSVITCPKCVKKFK